MKFKRKILTALMLASLILSKSFAVHGQMQTSVTDVVIEGLKENTTVYVSATLPMNATVHTVDDNKNVEWLLNKQGIATIKSTGNQATLTASQSGEVSVMARALNGSDASRSYQLKVRPFSASHSEFSIISGLIPIQQYGITTKTFQVEVSQQLSIDKQKSTLITYLNELKNQTGIQLNHIHDLPMQYRIYQVKLLNQPGDFIEFRVNLNTASASHLEDILNHLNSLPTQPDEVADKEEIKQPEQPTIPTLPEDTKQPSLDETDELKKPENAEQEKKPTDLDEWLEEENSTPSEVNQKEPDTSSEQDEKAKSERPMFDELNEDDRAIFYRLASETGFDWQGEGTKDAPLRMAVPSFTHQDSFQTFFTQLCAKGQLTVEKVREASEVISYALKWLSTSSNEIYLTFEVPSNEEGINQFFIEMVQEIEKPSVILEDVSTKPQTKTPEDNNSRPSLTHSTEPVLTKRKMTTIVLLLMGTIALFCMSLIKR